MSYKLKSSARLVNDDHTGTAEFISAIKPSTNAFQQIAVPTGSVSSTVNVVYKAIDQGNIFVVPTGTILTNPTLARGAVTLVLEFIGIVPMNPGDVLKFSYVVSGTPANNPKMYFSAL